MFYSEIRKGLERNSAMQNIFTSCSNAPDIKSFHVKPETSAGTEPDQCCEVHTASFKHSENG